MTAPFHPGELAVQRRAGVLESAAHVGGIIGDEIPAQVHAFLARQRLAIVGSADADGRVWASPLTGAPGMITVPDARTLHVAATSASGDPLGAALAGAGGRAIAAGVLVIDLANRRRFRVNGTAEAAPDGLLVHVRQAYVNCPKYIQQRAVVPADAPAADAPAAAATDHVAPPLARPATALTAGQRRWIERADTFFIASAHPVGGADASHRGGEPGFVRLARGDAGEDVLSFPDYSGNAMFNTLGNLATNPACGLLFLDFETGAALQLTGAAELLWEPAAFAEWPGAERAVRVRVAQVIELPDATPLRWRLVERSPFNPPAPSPHPATGRHAPRRGPHVPEPRGGA